MSHSASTNDLHESNGDSTQELLERYSSGERNFSRVTFKRAQLSHVVLSEADFSNSNLSCVEFHNVDLSQAIFLGSDLSYSIISKSNLSQANCGGADLACATLNGVNFKEANLVRANLWESSLQRSNLQGGNLIQACLKNANLKGANLRNTDLTLANASLVNLIGADLSTAILHRTSLSGALYDATTRFPKGFDPVLAGMNLVETDIDCCESLLESYRLGQRSFRRISLRKAYLGEVDLRGTDLSGSDLTEADLRYANLTKVILKGSTLLKTILIGANLDGGDLRGANLSYVQFEQGSLANAKLDRTNLGEASLVQTDCTGASLEQASLSGANLFNAILSRANFSYANLTNANLSSARLTGTNLSRANLSGADLSCALLDNTVFGAALYSSSTRWPEGFDPVSAGAIFAEPPHSAVSQLSPPIGKSPLSAAHQSWGGVNKGVGQANDRSSNSPSSSKVALSLKVFALFAVGLLLGQGYPAYQRWQNKLVPVQPVNVTISPLQVVPLDEPGVLVSDIDVFFGSHPSDERFDLAAQHYRNGEFQQAIATLSSITETSGDFELAQVTITLWQREWQLDLHHMERVQQEFQNQNWQAVVETADLMFTDYWRAMARPIADEARYKVALDALQRGDIDRATLSASDLSSESLQRYLAERMTNLQANEVVNLLDVTPVSTP